MNSKNCSLIEWVFFAKEMSDDESTLQQSPLWVFCRHLKSHPELERLTAHAAMMKVQREISGNWRMISPRISDDDQARVEFEILWDEINCPADSAPVEAAVHHASVRPLCIPESPSPKFTLFVSSVFYLSESLNTSRIFISLSRFAQALKTTPMTISRFRHLSQNRGYIALVSKHIHKPEMKGQAAEFEVGRRLLSEYVAQKIQP